MNYELCKKLKDAGFPLEAASLADYRTNKPSFEYGVDFIGRKGVWLYPALKKLIEECKEDFHALFRIVHVNIQDLDKRWKASARAKKSTQLHTFGSTPEEAVANLWLELNK